MTVWQIRLEPITALADVARVPISFLVESLLEVELIDGGLGGMVLRERQVDPPYLKDYDAYPERARRSGRLGGTSRTGR